MTVEDEINYKNGAKNHWRRTVWNRIVERLLVPPPDAVVLYLAGLTDLDRPEAIRRGFRAENLIAVDRSLEKAQALRNKSVLTIHGDFLDAAASFPRRVDVIFGDFCCGLSYDLMGRIFGIGLLPFTRQAVFAFNFLRGRDPGCLPQVWKRDNSGQVVPRGKMLWSYVASLAVANFLFPEKLRLIDGTLGLQELPSHQEQDVVYRAVCDLDVLPWTGSYKSGFQTFDSVVYPGLYCCESDNASAAAKFLSANAKAIRSRPLNKQIRAVLAHRTRRMQAYATETAR